MKIALIFGIGILLGLWSTPVYGQVVVSDDQARAIVSAIEDEIYDYHLQGNFRSVGRAISSEEFEIPLYVTTDSHGSSFYVIYRLMPYGELYRLITLREGTALLFRNPRSGFPPDAPASPTEYYDDDAICALKQHATRLVFTVQMHPSQQKLKLVMDAQRKRYGFSNLEEEQAKQRKDTQSHP